MAPEEFVKTGVFVTSGIDRAAEREFRHSSGYARSFETGPDPVSEMQDLPKSA